MLHSIGCVAFRDVHTGRYVAHLGDQRVAFLRRFYRHEPLGCYEPICTDRPGELLAWEAVRWDTAGLRVTG